MENIWAVILAAGESKRMGTAKMLLPFNGSTIIGNVIKNILDAGANGIIVVLGAESERIISEIRKYSVNFCINERFTEGMLSSVICGIENLPPECSSVMIQPGDQPLIKAETIKSLIDGKENSEFGIVVPVCNKKRGHPVVIDRKYSGEIRNLDSGKGLRSLLLLHPADVLEVETGDTGVLKDFDTYGDYLDEIHKK
ncbi:MAG TPA: nucleotidyltransferase family protein [Bacteroidales bacterium]|nr:nucleotidyltransferase family protein [Bacteroidales bacterium]